MKALNGEAADTGAGERGQYHRGVCLHQFDLSWVKARSCAVEQRERH
jgi:hypothetical protein